MYDFNDFEVGKCNGLVMINILNVDVFLNDEVFEVYRGMDWYVVCEKVVEDLKFVGLLEKIEEYKYIVLYGDCLYVVIEFWLMD